MCSAAPRENFRCRAASYNRLKCSGIRCTHFACVICKRTTRAIYGLPNRRSNRDNGPQFLSESHFVPDFGGSDVREDVKDTAVVRETGKESVDALTVRQCVNFADPERISPPAYLCRPPEPCVQICSIGVAGNLNVQAPAAVRNPNPCRSANASGTKNGRPSGTRSIVSRACERYFSNRGLLCCLSRPDGMGPGKDLIQSVTGVEHDNRLISPMLSGRQAGCHRTHRRTSRDRRNSHHQQQKSSIRTPTDSSGVRSSANDRRRPDERLTG